VAEPGGLRRRYESCPARRSERRHRRRPGAEGGGRPSHPRL